MGDCLTQLRVRMFTLSLSLGSSQRPVSYTHLDVYKRQMHACVRVRERERERERERINQFLPG